MAKVLNKLKKGGTGRNPRTAAAAKYDAHHSVLSKTYGAFADLRRELSDSKAAVAVREEMLRIFATCADSQRAWLLLEDYFEKLALSRKDFPGEDWWPHLLKAEGRARLEELAFLFLRAKRPLPTELSPHANLGRFAEIQETERERQLVQKMEHWLFPPVPVHLDAPRATLRVICTPQADEEHPARHCLAVQFHLYRSRNGDKTKTLKELAELVVRAAHEQELFPPADWDFITWLAETHADRRHSNHTLVLTDLELLHWLARWGDANRLELQPDHAGRAGSPLPADKSHQSETTAEGAPGPSRHSEAKAEVTRPTFLKFHGQTAALTPHLQNGTTELSFTHQIALPGGKVHPLADAKFFSGRPPLALVGNTFFLVRNAPPPDLLEHWAEKPAIPIRKLSHRLLLHLRNHGGCRHVEWDQLCTTHPAQPQFVFELADETVRLRLLAKSARDGSTWLWNGHDWQIREPLQRPTDQPELLDDVRLEPAIQWLRRLDWFTPEPGLWVGDANENFLGQLAAAWPYRPKETEYLGNPAFHRLFLQPRQLRPKIIVKGSGIDWLAVSAEWEAEGLKLSKADLERLAAATGRFVKLPDSGWVELDVDATQNAHEAMADLGIDGLDANATRIGLEQAAHLDDDDFTRFGDSPAAQALRERLKEFKGVPTMTLPANLQAELRPYQQEGFDFLCHLASVKLGGILADDMGLGKTLQALAWLAWLKERNGKKPIPSLVICPASVLHNWRREAEKFTPGMKVLVLESGAARHNLRKQIPQHDLIVTNYALLRRDLEELQKFAFHAVILDEAQFIKNPGAQVTLSVKQLKSDHRLALTGTPLENRLLDLWSIVDFIQPGYLGTQEHFSETYEPRTTAAPPGEIPEEVSDSADGVCTQRIARRRLAAKLRPLMLRRLKKHVAKDLPDRTEQRLDCNLGEDQKKLYLAELRRSRDQVMKAVETQGLNKSKMHVLAALTRLRQICCHPRLVGNDSASGKTDTMFELLEPLLAEKQKILVFSQFVQMLHLLEKECVTRGIKTHLLTGQTKDRQEVVNAFTNDGEPGVFLLSLRAAGTGLNLISASYVVLYDPWWNPAVEAQAIDRSHRIGQTQTVNAYRLIAPGTVEEKIWELQQSKAKTIGDVLGEEGFARSLSAVDLNYLFAED